MLPREKRHRSTVIVRSGRSDPRVSPEAVPPPAIVQDPHSAHHHSALKATPSGRSRRQGRRRRPPELGFSPERQGRGAEEQMYTDVSKKNNGALERRLRRGRPGPTKGFPPIQISSTGFTRRKGPGNHAGTAKNPQ
ncbi:putative WRKY transcription factor 35 [Hordeum vulgare]|nr:putative WRKY transcription factor 35 [Hordeum vulgare]